MSGKGMSFLNKKSWHTGGMPMLRKVWAAEERAKQEERTIEQLRREKAEERAVEESRRLQAQQGLITATPVDRLEWMYAGQAMSEAVKQEQYLLGAAVKDSKATDNAVITASVKAADDRWKKGGADHTRTGAGRAAGSTLDEAARLREDPLLAILREQHKRTQPTHTRPTTSNQTLSVTGAHDNSRKDVERPVKSESGEESARQAHGRRNTRSGRDDDTTDREREKREHRASRERERKRKRSHHRRSHSHDSSHSESSNEHSHDRERRRRGRRRRRSTSRSRSRESRSARSHNDDNRPERKGKEAAHETQRDAADERREQDRLRHDPLPSTTLDVGKRRAGAEGDKCEMKRGNDETHSLHSRHHPSSAPSASSSSLSPSPSVVSSAFLSSTTAFGGRLGLILPNGAPPPLPHSTHTATLHDTRHDNEARTSVAAAPAVTRQQPLPLPLPLPVPLPRPAPLASLNEAERQERLRAMQFDAESLLASRRQQYEVAQQQLSREHSERPVVVGEAECMSAPLFRSLRNAVVVEGSGGLKKGRFSDDVDER